MNFISRKTNFDSNINLKKQNISNLNINYDQSLVKQEYEEIDYSNISLQNNEYPNKNLLDINNGEDIKHEFDDWTTVPNTYLMSDGCYVEKVDENKYYKGIDVSTYQGTIDWNKVSEKVDFAILRVGITYKDGSLGLDDQFIRNIKECNRLGIPVGTYYFSRALSEEKNQEEINFILDAIKEYDISLPIYRDLESDCESDLCSGEAGRTRQAELTEDFCSAMEEAGYVGGLYIHKKHADSLPEIKGKYSMWCAGNLYYNSTNENDYSIDFDDMSYAYFYDDNHVAQPFKLTDDITMFQSSCEGIAASVGIDGCQYVDLNYADQSFINNVFEFMNISNN